jgi:hypothetical protein
MTHLFYFVGVFFIWHELRWIYAPAQMVAEAKKFEYLSKLNKGKKWDSMTPEYKSELKSKILLIPLFIWLFVGLFTVQWDAFLFIILFNFVVITPLSKLVKFSFAYTVIHWVNSVIGFTFGVFVIINHYHLHISLYEVIKTWLN